MTAAEIAEIAIYAKEVNQRFCQYLHNAVYMKNGTGDMFFIPDDELIVAVREYHTFCKEEVNNG